MKIHEVYLLKIETIQNYTIDNIQLTNIATDIPLNECLSVWSLAAVAMLSQSVLPMTSVWVEKGFPTGSTWATENKGA